MKVGILEIMAMPARNWMEKLYHTTVTKQMTSVTPQAISVWCRQMGHESFYTTYYGLGNIERFFPDDLDFIFISSSTITSPLSYAIAKLFRKSGIRTVIGGPHAKAYPADCLRFFDLVVKECDKELIADILADRFKPGSYISSKKPFEDLPTVEERLSEIKASAFYFKKRKGLTTVIPTITSMGCPYTCDFCTDWDKPYHLMPLERLETDLDFIAKKLPGVVLAFWEPNFAVKFERVFEVLEAVPQESRIPYMMECSQSVLSPTRVKRMKETNCAFFLIGVESWNDYSVKTGLGRKSSAREKFNRTIENFELLEENKQFMQASFIFGLDSDSGEEPISLTKEFINQTPYAWPTVNIPSPYGGTPLFGKLQSDNRLLKTMPFSFFQTPYLVTTIKNYNPLNYYEKLLEISTLVGSDELLKRRLEIAPNWKHKFYYKLRTKGERFFSQFYSQMTERFRSDSAFRIFHEGKSTALPEFYHQEFEKHLGSYSPLLSRGDRQPNLEQINPVIN
jgi:radical SAM superfamily enzyme YgiQ (UPF0313 family)